MSFKNIVIVNDYAHINGGASKVAIESAIGLSRKKYNVTFLGAVGPIDERLKENGVKVVCIEQNDILHSNRLKASMQGIWNRQSKKQFSELLDKMDKQNTIVHIHSWTKALSSSVIRVIVDKNFKSVLTLHDYFTVCPNGGLYNYNTKQICELNPMTKECISCNCDSRHYYYKLWRVIRQRSQQNRGRLPNGIKNYIYISQLSIEILKQYLPKESKFYYVKNPIDIEKSSCVNVNKNKDFVYVGRLSKEKGVLLFAEAAKELKCRAIFVGDGECREDIKRVYPEAEITGWKSNNEVKEYLKKARALVFPSLLYETLGLTALEAKAMGIPVIVSDKCTAREVINDGVSGLWFGRNNINNLKSKIQLMLNDELAYKLGKNAYEEYWTNPYDINEHIKGLEDCYKDILNS